jgi:tRNA (adenine22-N1)-methyltransferase
VTNSYYAIWDGCCDHGLLGASLLTRHAAKIIHFVDIVPELMTQLQQRLLTFFPMENTTANYADCRWQVHCADMATLSLDNTSEPQLVILSGIGGDLMSNMVSALLENNRTRYVDFLLCPVNNSYTLRTTLLDLGCALYQELLIEDNGRFYEVMFVSGGRKREAQTTMLTIDSTLTAVGHDIWHQNNGSACSAAMTYHKKLINHYRNMVKSSTNADVILQQYLNLRLDESA